MPIDPLKSSHPLPTVQRYRAGAIAFHWTMFGLVVIVGILGLLHDSWPKQTQSFWINIHALIGLLLWFVLLARFAHRLRHAPPTLPAGIGALSRRSLAPIRPARRRVGANVAHASAIDARLTAFLPEGHSPAALA
jgi:hypothetical protein